MQIPRKTTDYVSILSIITAFVGIWYICAFFIIDFDVWWHIAAGRIFRSGTVLIKTDPFAFTREGLPYLANHEWLSQIIISLVYDLFGVNGMIVFRYLLILLAVVPVLFIRPRLSWMFSPLVIFAVTAMRPAILFRPQLFSFVIFSFALFFSIAWLQSRISKKEYAVCAVILQIIWVNMHGGAAIIHLAIVGALLLQSLFSKIKSGSSAKQIFNSSALRSLGILIVLLIISLFASPSSFNNISYIKDIFTGGTSNFIAEWAPRSLPLYFKWIVPLWGLSLILVLSIRRSLIYSLLLIFTFGYLSTKAIRHEPFFVITALFISCYQISGSLTWENINNFFKKKVFLKLVVIFLLLILVLSASYKDKYINSIRFGQNGFGSYQPLSSAVEFIEDNKIDGLAFNNYEAGGYLLFRGYPNRKVFVDGRNIDYGYQFLDSVFESGSNSNKFRMLESEYEFTVAIIQFDYYKNETSIPYVSVLNSLPDWGLVYADDTSAVYVKRDVHSDIVFLNEYKVLTPEILLNTSLILSNVPSASFKLLEKDLNTALATSLESVGSKNFRIRLAKAALYYSAGLTPEAEVILAQLQSESPYRYETYNLLAIIKAEQGEYIQSGILFEQAMKAGGGGKLVSIDYEYLSTIFYKAGDSKKANMYKQKALKQDE
ncbi:tetratricopeptide repeat protein [Candidatus Peregrinibacteria bacterium]|jgi:hypothetical protein|nr:tetratricopeptide repeat protein [Candidatus Peregrinibacteria bacterium]MBT3598966.1 tetratricopeptide repeat protein [Candidatus Peregrinibacteria bacterium]MBT4366871.1 tetratricopeptide repeat protein [Candidatus Peregrinibacteria bacterium]MBT4585508.1 tetratricopeptide repeat protein [Candidatus Peregrinibacteria bacterium]MBT6731323.1 tetratricopeptide repeat protein [Candidatus Peregrinibacteria bacterium]